MSSFTFTSAPIATLASGEYYVLPVDILPSSGFITRSQLSIAGNAQPTILSNNTLTSTLWNFAATNIPDATYPNPLVGLVIIKKVGAAPASIDLLVNFSPFLNSLGVNAPPPAGTYGIVVSFPNGAMTLAPVYQYNSATYNDPGIGNLASGLMYLLATQNNTIPFINPTVSGKVNAYRLGNNVANVVQLTPASLISFNRVLVSDAPADDLTCIVDFKDYRVKIDVVANVANFWPPGWVLYGSNSFNNISNPLTLATSTNLANWTLLATTPSNNTGSWSSAPVTNPTFWQYLRFERAASIYINSSREVEFFGSIQGLNANLVP